MRKLLSLLVCALVGTTMLMAQSRNITGSVISNEDGEPIIGASVRVTGTDKGTITDGNGRFSLSVPADAKTLTFSYIGMETVEASIHAKMNIALRSSEEVLDDVLVVAYGTAKKSSFTGSAAQIKGDKIAVQQTSNVTNALAGQVAGVQTFSSNGQPGTGSTIRIRGIGSFSAANDPLYVVDGVPFDGDISTINPQDIASMTVLKDAASNALYGARGANGVIIITTKQGVKGQQAKVTVDAKWGTNRRAVPNYDVIKSPALYYEEVYKAIYNGQIYMGRTPDQAHSNANAYIFGKDNGGVGYQVYTVPEGQDFIGTDGKINPNATLGYSDGTYYYTPDDWYKELFDDGNLRQEYNVNVSGASERMNYYASFGYLEDTGITENSGFNRYSGRLNADYQVKDWLKLNTAINYAHTRSMYPANQSGGSSANLFYVANEIAPIYPLYARNADGSIMVDEHGYTVYDYGDVTTSNFVRAFMSMSNPASAIALDQRQYDRDAIGAKVGATADLYKGLQLHYNYSIDVSNLRQKRLYNAYYGQYAGRGIVLQSANRTEAQNAQALLTYNTTIAKHHHLDALLGYEQYKLKMEYLSGQKEKLFNPRTPEIDNAILDPQTSSSMDNYKTRGILARLQYDYDEQYYLSASFRRDASSRFHPDNRWGNFWSIGGAWAINKESWLDYDWIDFLKFKASYGQQGNDDLGNYYAYLDQYVITANGTDFATTLSYKGNKDLTWETSHNFNVGFDFSVLHDRVGGSVEYYLRKTEDMLYYKPVPSSLGYSEIPMNIGSVINRGIEFDLYGTPYRSKNIEVRLNANATFGKSIIDKLAPELNGVWKNGSMYYEEGKARYRLYTYKWAGVAEEDMYDDSGKLIAYGGDALWYKDVYQTDADGQNVLDDNGDPIVTGQTVTNNYREATRYSTGDLMAKVYGGFGASLRVYDFDLSVSLAYQLGGKLIDYTYMDLMHGGNDAGRGWHKDILNAWTPDNTKTDVPKLNTNTYYQYVNSMSDRFLVSSNYLSLQNVTVGYNVPKKLTRKAGIDGVRLYFVADNVALWSKRKGLDPRQGYISSDNTTYSPIRSLSGGLTVTF